MYTSHGNTEQAQRTCLNNSVDINASSSSGIIEHVKARDFSASI